MSYRKIGNRISLLPISQYCGLSAQLSEAHGAGRAAAMSSAFHALAAGMPNARELFFRLSPEEQITVSTWSTPSPVTVMGQELTYEEALKEQPVGLNVGGEFAPDGDVVTCGTLDFGWVVADIAYVADMKKTPWTTSGPDSLQLLTYGYAFAKQHKCRVFCVGLWIIEDAEWRWSDETYSVDDFEALDLWARIKGAALNTSGEANFGKHCSDCYGKLHCPEFVAPASLAETVLAPICEGGPIDDGKKLGEMLAYVQRVKSLIERAEELAKDAAQRGVKVVHPATGKSLVFTRCKGRAALDRERLFEEIPEAKNYMKRGADYFRSAWK